MREHVRDTFWFTPTFGLVATCLLWGFARLLDRELAAVLSDTGVLVRDFTEDAKTVVTTVSQAMMTFIAVVFSISLVALQMASGQLTPRIVRIFVRSRVTKLTLAVFLSTFVFSLLVLTSYNDVADPDRATPVPLFQSGLTLLLVALSLVLFIAYVTATLRLMQVGPVADRIAREALRAVRRQPAGHAETVALSPEKARVVHFGKGGVLRDVDTAHLVRTAHRHDLVLRIIPRIGDYLVPGAPLLTVHPRHAPPPTALTSLSSAFFLGTDRTIDRDPGFALRQLTDIALRALSPAVNDPTTAVQCLDRVLFLLAMLAPRPLGAVIHRDQRGQPRLVQTMLEWTDLVDLAFAELRAAAAGSAQVTRRMMAGFDDLLAVVPSERRQPLLRHRLLLEQAVERVVTHPADRTFALQPDRQGIS